MNAKANQVESTMTNDRISRPAPAHPGANMVDGLSQIRKILLGDFIVRWENRLREMEKNVHDLIEKTNDKLEEIDGKFENLDRELKEELETNFLEIEQENDDLREMIQKAREELNEKLKALEESKMDKDSVADVFIHWGKKMRGEE